MMKRQCTQCDHTIILLEDFKYLNSIVIDNRGRIDLKVLKKMASLVNELYPHWRNSIFSKQILKCRGIVHKLINQLIN